MDDDNSKILYYLPTLILKKYNQLCMYVYEVTLSVHVLNRSFFANKI